MSETHGRRGRRTKWFVAAAVTIVLLGVTTVVVLTRTSPGSASGAPPPPKVETAPVTRTDLTDAETASGTLGYGVEHAVGGRKPGTVTWLPEQGATIERGGTVFGVDARPVPLFYGKLPFFRDLAEGAPDGPDVKVLEENLKALGFTGFGKPDEKFTAATATALKKWQKALKLPETGTLAQGDVVVEPGPIRISETTARLGAQATGDVLKATGTAKAVTVELEATKRDLAQQGAKVDLEVTGGNSGTGTISSVGTDAQSGGDDAKGGGGEEKPKVKVTITLDDPRTAGSLDSAPVDVKFPKGEREGVLAVPVGALLALAEGGYAVEVADGGQRRLLPVKTGLFANGQVEVSGDGLREGMRVVTTS
ncbi:peptidoglycan-binding protein [Amycolatopsis anabasis]|uniref:peptidoglycan-binding protein n=1 Tax=Amycolatopsis anabasis TaxID=1840409 RepID=UPI00131E33D2|nr:peptidoglycan-binding protein [Amycolatopsis anabasis]